jgi:hypothetical protein
MLIRTAVALAAGAVVGLTAYSLIPGRPMMINDAVAGISTKRSALFRFVPVW